MSYGIEIYNGNEDLVYSSDFVTLRHHSTHKLEMSVEQTFEDGPDYDELFHNTPLDPIIPADKTPLVQIEDPGLVSTISVEGPFGDFKGIAETRPCFRGFEVDPNGNYIGVVTDMAPVLVWNVETYGTNLYSFPKNTNWYDYDDFFNRYDYYTYYMWVTVFTLEGNS
jgi:hypothetical protein